MKNENTNSEERAFPFLTADDCGDFGLTKREYFAGLAMLGRNSCQSETYNGNIEGIAKYAVEMADALLEELSKS
jgi:hypothetical protein